MTSKNVLQQVETTLGIKERNRLMQANAVLEHPEVFGADENLLGQAQAAQEAVFSALDAHSRMKEEELFALRRIGFLKRSDLKTLREMEERGGAGIEFG